MWFDHDAHESVEEFVCHWPLAYVEFDAHDRYDGHTQYEMEQLFRVFLIKVLHGWAHETALVTHLETHPELRQRLDFQTVPDQSTLWRTWQYRFTSDLREPVTTAARTILVKAETAGVAVPREPERTLPRRGRDDHDDASAEERTPLEWTSELTDHVAQFTRPVFSLDRGKGGEITLELLHTLHETLLTDVPSERRETGTIGEFNQVPNRAGTFLTPPPGEVEGMVDALVTYLRTGGRYHAIVDTALVHYQFETIHPYGDGNGRMGRLLITLQLYAAGYLEDRILYLSEYFNRNKQTYVDRMDAVRTDGQWEAWIEFFVEGVKNQAKEAVHRAQELSKLEDEYKQTYGGRPTATARLARNLFEIPYFTANDVAAFLDVQPSTAYRAIGSLQEAGLLEEVTDKDRYREYRAREIFEILEQPPQTY